MSYNKSVPILPLNGVPANNGTSVLFDQETVLAQDFRRTATHGYQRIRVVFFFNQAVTYYHSWAGINSTTLRVANGNAAGEAVPASTLFVRDELLLPGRNQISIVAGATAPTTWEIAMEAVLEANVGLPG
jgi:hypothetical protein